MITIVWDALANSAITITYTVPVIGNASICTNS